MISDKEWYFISETYKLDKIKHDISSEGMKEKNRNENKDRVYINQNKISHSLNELRLIHQTPLHSDWYPSQLLIFYIS